MSYNCSEAYFKNSLSFTVLAVSLSLLYATRIVIVIVMLFLFFSVDYES